MFTAILCSIFVFPIATLQAQTISSPSLVNYQGRLTSSDGNGVTGTRKLEFNVYDETGSKHWGPQIFGSVTVVDGHFNVILGTDTTGRGIAEAFDGKERFLGIKVDDSVEISPRQQILSTPYAIQADRVSGKVSGIDLNSHPFLRGYLQGCLLEYNSISEISINPGYLEIDGSIYAIESEFIKTINGAAGEMRYLYFVKPLSKSTLNANDLESSTTPPTWDSLRLGWYKSGDNTRRCIGMVYMLGANEIAPFDYIDGEYLYRSSFDKGRLENDVTSVMELYEVPSCARMATGLAWLRAYKYGSSYLYTHPTNATTSSKLVVHSYFKTEEAGDAGGSCAYIKTVVVPKGSFATFSYYFDKHYENDDALYHLHSFYWRPDKE